jgi:hypothetical protein
MAARGSVSEYLTGGPLVFIYLIARRRLGSNHVSGWRPASSIRWRHAVTLAAMTAHAVSVRPVASGWRVVLEVRKVFGGRRRAIVVAARI